MKQKSMAARVVPPVLALLVLIFAIRFFTAPVETIKWIGAPFMVLPTALGIVPAIAPESVRTISLQAPAPVLDVPAAGQYAVYADSTDMLLRANMVAQPYGKEGDAPAWMTIHAVGSDDTLPSANVGSGAQIWHPVGVPGRPVVSFALPRAGQYQLVFNKQSGDVYFAPDPVTGREVVLALAVAAQIAVVAGAAAIWFWPRIRAGRAKARLEAAELERKRAEAAEFVRQFGGKER